jgi:hypothetical protein
MAAASAELNPDRRNFLATAASIITFAVAVPPSALSATTDPILAAIELHREATAAMHGAVDIHGDLERELPREKRRSSVDAHGEKVVTTDDPRWIESEYAVASAFDAETNAAVGLVNVLPTTFAGVIALLQYAISADQDGETWPDDLLADESSQHSRSWHHFLIANLAEILPSMVRA